MVNATETSDGGDGDGDVVQPFGLGDGKDEEEGFLRYIYPDPSQPGTCTEIWTRRGRNLEGAMWRDDPTMF